jgi:hypothetical protein
LLISSGSQDSKKSNKGSNGLIFNPQTLTKEGLMSQAPAKEESNPCKEIKGYKEKEVGLINQTPTTGSNQYIMNLTIIITWV